MSDSFVEAASRAVEMSSELTTAVFRLPRLKDFLDDDSSSAISSRVSDSAGLGAFIVFFLPRLGGSSFLATVVSSSFSSAVSDFLSYKKLENIL